MVVKKLFWSHLIAIFPFILLSKNCWGLFLALTLKYLNAPSRLRIPHSPHSQTHYICPSTIFVIFLLEMCVECSQL